MLYSGPLVRAKRQTLLSGHWKECVPPAPVAFRMNSTVTTPLPQQQNVAHNNEAVCLRKIKSMRKRGRGVQGLNRGRCCDSVLWFLGPEIMHRIHIVSVPVFVYLAVSVSWVVVQRAGLQSGM